MFIVDAHLDLAYNVMRGRDVTKPAAEQPAVDNETATVGLPDLRKGGVALVCATIFCPPRNYKNRGYTTADDGFAPRRATGFVDAMRHALGAYLRFAGASRLDWAAHLAADKQLFPELTG